MTGMSNANAAGMRLHPITAALCFAISCAAPAEQFRPTAESGVSRSGQPAAAYEVRDDGGRVAQVSVWSQGAYGAADGATYVHIGVEVQNVGAGAVTLDGAAAQLEAFDSAGAPLPPTRLASVLPAGPAQRVVVSSSATDVDLVFALAPGILPMHVASLRLRWTLVQPDERRYVQFTDFSRDEARPAGAVYAYVPVFGFYDPFFWSGPRVRVIVPHHVHVRRIVVVPRHRHR